MHTQLYWAAVRGDLAVAKNYLDKGANHNAALAAAAGSRRATVDMLQLLVSYGANPNQPGNAGKNSPLIEAIACKDLSKVRYLVEAGADPHYLSERDYNAISNTLTGEATEQEKLEVLEYFLQLGVAPQTTSKISKQPLGIAAQFMELSLIKALLKVGLTTDVLSWNELAQAVVFGTLEDVRTLLASYSEEALAEALVARDYWERTPFLLALQVGDLTKVQLLADSGAKWNDQGRWGNSLLHATSTPNGNPEVVKWLLQKGADVNEANMIKHTALREAVEYNNVESVKALLGAVPVGQTESLSEVIPLATSLEMIDLLLSKGANINHVNKSGDFLLASAAKLNDAKLINELLARGAAVDNTEFGDTALHTAAVYDSLEAARILLASGANPNAYNKVDLDTPLLNAHSIEMFKLLLENGANINAGNSADWGILGIQSDPEVLEFLIEQGAELNPRFGESSPLLRAIEKHDLKLAAFFIEKGANLERATSWGKTALMEACENSYVEGVKLLLQAGANPAARDKKGLTPLFYAAAPEAFVSYQLEKKFKNDKPDRYSGYVASDSLEVLEILVGEVGVDINTQNISGQTALMLAAGAGRPARVRGLLALGADVEIRDAKGRTALFYAATMEAFKDREQREEIIYSYVEPDSTEMLELLVREAGANINATDNFGQTALMLAAKAGHPTRVQGLLALGADPKGQQF